MHRSHTIFLLFLSALILSLSPSAGSQVRPSLHSLYDSLANPVLDEDRAADMSDIILFRGGQEITFTRGSLRLFRPVNGKIFGGIFTGEGTFTLYLPTEAERVEFERQMKKELEGDRYVFGFTRAVLWFQDTLLREFGPGLDYGRSGITREERESVVRSGNYITDKSNEDVVYSLIAEMMDSRPKPFLFAHFFLPEKREIFLKYDLRRFEEVAVYRPPYESVTGAVFWLEMVNSFHLPEEYSEIGEYGLSSEDKNRFDWLDNRIDLGIEKNGDITGDAEVRVRRKDPVPGCLTFFLDPDLTVDSIRDADGGAVQYHRREKSWSGFLVLPPGQGQEVSLRFYYHGEFLSLFKGLNYYMYWGGGGRLDGMFYMPRSSTGWYPASTTIDRVRYDVRYTYPADLTLVASGSFVSDSVRGDRKVSRYTSPAPDLITSFSLGYFESEKFQLSDTEAVVTVYDVGTGKAEEVGKDCANSFRLFSHLFGSPPFRQLRVTGGPLAHGQAFREFVHLPWYDEFVGEKQSAISIGRAHEVAHAWWGHGVGWGSYHDQWLSEAIAEYAALLYAPFVLKSDEEFLEKLEDWKERIIGARKYSLGSGAELGSIWLGYRTSSSQTRGDYALSTYRKGAWVVHMLRMMLIDFRTMKEDAFGAMMREFYQENAGRDPTTADFIRVTEKYFGMDMKWFFDQWVYGTEVPTLHCSHTIARTPEGRYEVKISVGQKDVSNPFRIFLPFELEYRNGSKARARLEITQAQNDFSYVLDVEPVNVRYNIMESVLCTVED